jgi:hypothetical protein
MKFIRTLLVAAAVVANVAMLQAKTYTIGDGGSLAWNRFTGSSCDCPSSGSNCKISNKLANVNVLDAGTSWSVTGVLEEANAEIILDHGGLYLENFKLGNYTFHHGYFEVLPDEFPGVPAGTRIDLGGVVTNPDGNFRAMVPKGPAN